MTSDTPLLQVSDLSVAYGRIEVLHDVALEVHAGEIVALVGANGAGKTTLLKAISGLLKPRRGRIELDGENVTGMPPHKLVRRGLAHVPEGRRVFGRFDIAENLRVGAFTRADFHSLGDEIDQLIESVPALARRRKSLASGLSGGEQQLLAVYRALMSKPRFLLLDEPSMGLAPVLVDSIFELIERLHGEGVTILLVEQNAVAAMDIADRAYVLASGQMTKSGSAKEMVRDPEFANTFLGI